MFLHYILDARVDEDSSVAIGPVLDLLVSEGAHVDPSDPVFWCLAGSAASAGFVRHLVSLGPPDEECLGGALEGACMAGQRDVVELLLPIAKEQDGYADLLGQLADTAFDAERTDVLAALLEQYALVHPVEGSDDRCEDGSEDGFDDESEDGFEDGSYDGSYDGLSQDDSYGGFEGESEDPIPRESLLIYAAACGDAALVARLLSSGCDVTGVVCSSTALAHATDPAIIRMLLDAKADVDPPGCVHMLKAACSKLRPDAVKALLDAGAGVGKDKHDNPALVFAISTEVPPEKVEDHVAIINLLVDAGADTRSLRRGQSALQSCFHCLRMNKENVVIRTIEVLLRRDPGLLECRNEEGLTPLMYLLNEGMLCPAVAKALVDAGADVEAADQRGRTPLHHLLGGGRGGCAKYLEKWEILQLLLGAGARATACDGEGKTVLMDALERPRVGPSWFAADDYAANIFVSGVIRHITTRC
jgi:ankyrin repeat protein